MHSRSTGIRAQGTELQLDDDDDDDDDDNDVPPPFLLKVHVNQTGQATIILYDSIRTGQPAVGTPAPAKQVEYATDPCSQSID